MDTVLLCVDTTGFIVQKAGGDATPLGNVLEE